MNYLVYIIYQTTLHTYSSTSSIPYRMNDNSHIPRQLATGKSAQLFQFKSLLAVEIGFWLGFVLQPVRSPRRHSIIVYFRGFSFIVQPKSICPVGSLARWVDFRSTSCGF